MPATIIDRDGIILDINPAFIEYAASLGRHIVREDRVGKHISDFARGQYRQFTGTLSRMYWPRAAHVRANYRPAMRITGRHT